MTEILTIRAAARAYDVIIGQGIHEKTAAALQERGVTPDEKLFIVTDEHVASFGYAHAVEKSLTKAGYNVKMAILPPGDGTKTLATATTLYNALLDAGVRRNGVILAVGGGMVGDLAGFVAATYLRGIRFVQVPTTLLAHDSSLGGKVGVNLPRGKNLVGAFHPPLVVLYDTGAMATLPVVEWQGGMAELIKHGIIADPSLFHSLTAHPLARYPGPTVLEPILAQGCAVKVRIVEADERESGRRMALNLGHTVGHAVEQISKYTINHGCAVAIGMSVEAELAVQRGWLDDKTRDDIRAILSQHDLPVAPPDYHLDEIFTVLGVDKKHGSHGWTFALPRAIGSVDIVHDVAPDEVAAAWRKTREIAQ